MSKKVFSVMIGLVLAFAFMAQAQPSPDVLAEIRHLQSRGYFDLPDHHMVNGTSVADWKKYIAQLESGTASRATAAGIGLQSGVINRIMTAGPRGGVVPQTIFGALGAIFLHDFVISNARLHPITGEELPPTAWQERYPHADTPFLFRFNDWTAPPANGNQRESTRAREFMKLPGVYRNPG